MMLFFVLLAFFYLARSVKKTGVSLGIAAGVKLIPVILIPLFFGFFKGNKKWRFLLFFFLLFGLTMLPIFVNGGGGRFFESLRLYHGKFEFNASLYYLLRYPLMAGLGFNPIYVLSPVLTVLTAGLIVWIAFIRKRSSSRQLLETAVFLYLIYLVLHTVVHPWYLLVPLGLSVLTSQRYFIAWSYLVFLSYASYQTDPVKETWWMLVLQYVALAFFVWKDIPTIRKNVLFW
jgi:hypothetical protein